MRVLVLASAVTPLTDEFSRRGIPYEDAPARLLRIMATLGVGSVEVVRLDEGGTENAARVLPGWCAREGVRSIVVLTGADHSRRIRRVLHRTMAGSPTSVAVRFSRYSGFSADTWWEYRGGQRAGIVELEKLMLDVIRHPLS